MKTTATLTTIPDDLVSDIFRESITTTPERSRILSRSRWSSCPGYQDARFLAQISSKLRCVALGTAHLWSTIVFGMHQDAIEANLSLSKDAPLSFTYRPVLKREFSDLILKESKCFRDPMFYGPLRKVVEQLLDWCQGTDKTPEFLHSDIT